VKPEFLRVLHCEHETADVITLAVQAPNRPTRAAFEPGQFNMLYAFGVGEVPISMSGDPGADEHFVHTIRAVGPVSDALVQLKPDDTVGVRGPFGTSWPVAQAVGQDVLLVAGGIGLAPLRPALYQLLQERQKYRRVGLLYGARSPKDLLFQNELAQWRRREDVQVRVTVDSADRQWAGDVGVLTDQLPKMRFDPDNTTVMICGPEIVIRMTGNALGHAGVARDKVFVSMERNMKCAIGLCGHCQFGPEFICRDGPVFPLSRVDHLLGIREI